MGLAANAFSHLYIMECHMMIVRSKVKRKCGVQQLLIHPAITYQDQ